MSPTAPLRPCTQQPCSALVKHGRCFTAALNAAIAKERAACAKIADSVPSSNPYVIDTGTMWRKVAAEGIAAAIRARATHTTHEQEK